MELAIVGFDPDAPLVHLLTARGMRVRTFASLPAGIEALRTLRTSVLVVRLPLTIETRGTATFVIRNIQNPAMGEEHFHDQFAEFFAGPVDPETLCAAVIRHATVSADAYPRRAAGFASRVTGARPAARGGDHRSATSPAPPITTHTA